ncbi:hypothetical protein TWF694_006954 [Orbilia ellipsospora]|uniref:Uncharacterized protein n=1 Tax=Orbilia ellipsospora TaxID=2528407 RepID=A0AAV9XLM3_9PEZI
MSHENPALKDGGWYAIMNAKNFQYLTRNSDGSFTLENAKDANAFDQTFQVSIKDDAHHTFSLKSSVDDKYLAAGSMAPSGSSLRGLNSDSSVNYAVWTPSTEFIGVYTWFFILSSGGGTVLDADSDGNVSCKPRKTNGWPYNQGWRFIVVDGSDEEENDKKRIKRQKQLIKARKEANS